MAKRYICEAHLYDAPKMLKGGNYGEGERLTISLAHANEAKIKMWQLH